MDNDIIDKRIEEIRLKNEAIKSALYDIKEKEKNLGLHDTQITNINDKLGHFIHVVYL